MIKTYDPLKLSVIINGKPITGFAVDTMLEISLGGDYYGKAVDIHGNVVRYSRNTGFATVVLTLTQSSSSHDYLSKFVEADQLGHAGQFAITIKDDNGSTVISSASAYIENNPDAISFGAELKDWKWTIIASNIQQFIGASGK